MNDEVTDRQRRYTLFMLVLVFTSSHVDRQIMGILGQPIKESLMISDTQLGLLTGIMFAVFYATLGMPMAMWADRNNRRNLISFSVFLWSLMTALCAAASNFMQLLLLRIGVGVGEAGSNPPSHSMIADLYPPERRSTAMAIYHQHYWPWLGALFGRLFQRPVCAKLWRRRFALGFSNHNRYFAVGRFALLALRGNDQTRAPECRCSAVAASLNTRAVICRTSACLGM